MSDRPLATLCAALLLSACGGGSPGGPSGGTPSPPPTTQPPGFDVSGFVFYDENGDGVLDQGEDVRIPNATITIAGRTGSSTSSGAFTVSGVTEGAQTAVAEPGSLPSYYEPGPAQAVSVPQASGQGVAVPVMLDIGRNRTNLYMAFGDSITAGDGSRDGQGYRSWLVELLRDHFGRASVADQGRAGTRSNQGVERMGSSLNTVRPAFTLIMYGTNDWNQLQCKNVVGEPCFTLSSLRSMIGQARSVRSQPILATIPPVNPTDTLRAPPERQQWVADTNELLREMAASENTVVADVHAALLDAGPLPDLFADHVHPNDAGYEVIARAFLAALTDASLRATAAPRFGFAAPAAPAD